MQLAITRPNKRVTRFLIEVSLKSGKAIMKPNNPKEQSGTWIVDMRFPIKPHRSAQKKSTQASAALPAGELNILGLDAAGKGERLLKGKNTISNCAL